MLYPDQNISFLFQLNAQLQLGATLGYRASANTTTVGLGAKVSDNGSGSGCFDTTVQPDPVFLQLWEQVWAAMRANLGLKVGGR